MWKDLSCLCHLHVDKWLVLIMNWTGKRAAIMLVGFEPLDYLNNSVNSF